MVMSTERKVAVITGASQGIGAGLVRGFLDRSYRVVANSRSIQPDASADVPAALASLTKGGLDAVTRSLAIEYADRGIRVNAVAPGVIKTPMHAPETHGFLAGLHPLGRMGEVREIVEAVLYLESAAFVTGETLHVDGGAHAGHW